MGKYCTKCGKELNSQGRCESCPPAKPTEVLNKLIVLGKKIIAFCLDCLGFGSSTPGETVDIFERSKKVVPDCVKPNEDEIPIRQYNIAKLRSRILQKYAEGKLMATNKRILFRAAGFSLTGRTALQYEFNVGEIGGIDIKKSYRLSFLNILGGVLMAGLVSEPFKRLFEAFNDASVLWSCIVGCLVSLALAASFLLLKKKFWLKFVLLSCAMGTMTGINSISSTAMELATGNYVFGFIDAISMLITVVWLFNLMIVGMVPELRMVIKTKSAGETVHIRKKVWGFFLKQHNEYTDFGEVLPWTDTDKAINELGALIDDIQTMGDYAIEKWKEEDMHD